MLDDNSHRPVPARALGISVVALAVETVLEMMEEGRDTQFDGKILNVFLEEMERIEDIRVVHHN